MAAEDASLAQTSRKRRPFLMLFGDDYERRKHLLSMLLNEDKIDGMCVDELSCTHHYVDHSYRS